MKQRIELIVGAAIDPNRFHSKQHQEQLISWVNMAVQDHIDRIQGGQPTDDNYNDSYCELEFGEPL